MFSLKQDKARYCRAPGSMAKIFQINKNEFYALIILPSKIKKIISLYSIVSRGPILRLSRRTLPDSYAGHLKYFGKKSVVRGVAMNPIDHPHGGNTKSIKLPLTP